MFTTMMWNRPTLRDRRFACAPLRRIVVGRVPHVGVANPLFKTPRRVCRVNNDYDAIDLTSLGVDYLPRTVYSPSCPIDEYHRRIPFTPWGTKYTETYRLLARNWVGSTSERTLVVAICPPKVGHLYTLLGIAFQDMRLLSLVAALLSSIVADFYIKVTGRTHIFFETLGSIPLVSDLRFQDALTLRVLQLNCLTRYYATCGESGSSQATPWTRGPSPIYACGPRNSPPSRPSGRWIRLCAPTTNVARHWWR